MCVHCTSSGLDVHLNVMTQPSLIAIDWGTTSARAYALDASGHVVAERSAPLGVQNVTDGNFAAALASLWPEAPDSPVPIIASGMIGSRQGWVEAPYCACPASLETIAASVVHVEGTRLSIVPGLRTRSADGIVDVMRGEEAQVFGALAADATRGNLIVLPGTHSKWCIAGERNIETFATFMTGELYALLREHSILGRLAKPGRDDMALARGVRHSLRNGAALSHDLFSARTLALVGELADGCVEDYLSGLLLGAEFVGATRWLASFGIEKPIVALVGDPALTARYRRALAVAGIVGLEAPPAAAALGLWKIAQQAGMINT
jgi:2-dehydro-3-deoxygalactonokinase